MAILYSTLKGTNQEATLPPPRHANVLNISASIFNEALGVPYAFDAEVAAKYGETVTMYNRGISGATLQSWDDTHLQTVIDELGSINDMLVIFVVGGNNVTGTVNSGGYPSISAASKAELETRIDSICNRIKAVPGWTLCMLELGFRDYGSVVPPTQKSEFFDTWHRESRGSLLYNQHIWWPKIQEHSDPRFVLENGESVAQNYWLFQNRPEMVYYDGIHPDRAGGVYLRRHIIDTVMYANFIGKPTHRLNRRHGERTISTPKELREIKFSFGVILTDGTYPAMRDYCYNEWHSGLHMDETVEFTKITDLKYYKTWGSSGISFHTSTDSGVGQAYNTLEFNTQTEVDALGLPLDVYQFRSQGYINTGETTTLTFSGLEAGKSYTFQFTGSRSGASEDRITQIVHGATTQTYQTSYSDGSGNQGQYAEFTGVVGDANGDAIFTVTSTAGSFAYMAGFNIIEE